MKIEYLRELIVLATTLNFHQAAENMFITDSALSRHVLAVENELGAKLFYRDTKTVRLTPMGEQFLGEIQALVSQYDKICTNIAMQTFGYKHTLKLALPYYAMADFLGDAQYHFSTMCKDVALDYSVRSPLHCISALLQDEVDATICPYYPFMHSYQLTRTKLFYEPLIVVMAPDHPFASREKLTLQDLERQIILAVDNHYHKEVWNHYQEQFRRKGIEIAEPIKLRQIESVRSACISLRAVYITPWHMRHHFSKPLAFVPLDEPELCREVCLLSRSEKPHPALKIFIKAFRSVGIYGWSEIAPDWPKKLGWSAPDGIC